MLKISKKSEMMKKIVANINLMSLIEKCKMFVDIIELFIMILYLSWRIILLGNEGKINYYLFHK